MRRRARRSPPAVPIAAYGARKQRPPLSTGAASTGTSASPLTAQRPAALPRRVEGDRLVEREQLQTARSEPARSDTSRAFHVTASQNVQTRLASSPTTARRPTGAVSDAGGKPHVSSLQQQHPGGSVPQA